MVHTTDPIPSFTGGFPSAQTLVPEAATVADTTVSTVSTASSTLMHRLGLEALPSHEPLHLPIDRLLVSDEALIRRSARRLVKSIQQVGVLQRPSVVVRDGRDIHDAEATFEVIAGRRRVLAARMAGLPVLACEVYTSSTLPLSSLLTLIENTQRSAAWVQEVAALRYLLDEKVGLTADDLATFGFDHVHLAERLKIARLPAPLLAYVLTGTMSRDVARKLIRLTGAQQERVAALAEAGEEVTAERVKEALRVQIANGLHPLQATLAQSWHPLPPNRSLPAPPMHVADTSVAPAAKQEAQFGMDEVVISSFGEATNGVTGVSPCEALVGRPVMAGTAGGGRPALEDLLQSLRCFQHSEDYRMAPRPIQTLTEALAQQIGLALRTPSRSEHSSHEPCETHEAEHPSSI